MSAGNGLDHCKKLRQNEWFLNARPKDWLDESRALLARRLAGLEESVERCLLFARYVRITVWLCIFPFIKCDISKFL